MGLFTSINIAATGMSVERLRTDVISNNIANATSTRTQEGGAYRRQSVVVEPIASKNPQWRFPCVFFPCMGVSCTHQAVPTGGC